MRKSSGMEHIPDCTGDKSCSFRRHQQINCTLGCKVRFLARQRNFNSAGPREIHKTKQPTNSPLGPSIPIGPCKRSKQHYIGLTNTHYAHVIGFAMLNLTLIKRHPMSDWLQVYQAICQSF